MDRVAKLLSKFEGSDRYIDKLSTSTTLEEALETALQQIKDKRKADYRLAFAELKLDPQGRTPEQVVKAWVDRVTSKAFQGRYGHAVYGSSTHHLVVAEKDYEVCKATDVEKLACAMVGSKYSLAEKASQEVWGN